MMAGLLHLVGVPVTALVSIDKASRQPKVLLSAVKDDFQVMIELAPTDADALAAALVRYAALARAPGSCAGNRDTIPVPPPPPAAYVGAVSNGDMPGRDMPAMDQQV